MSEHGTDHRKALGRRGERLVAERLEARGFQILATNFQSRWGEIDIVARRGGAIWFVEVKSRSTAMVSVPSVSWKQQHRLTRMAYHFLQRYEEPFDSVQFVVAAVSFDARPPRVEWIEQAFEGTF